MIAGGDKGKVGTVIDVNTKRGEVLVEGVNIKVRAAAQDWSTHAASTASQPRPYHAAPGATRRTCTPAHTTTLL